MQLHRFALPVLLTLAAIATLRADGPLAWKKLPPLPDPLGVAAPFAGATLGGLIVAGGANFPGEPPWRGGKKVWHTRVWLLDKMDGQWRDAGQLPKPRAYGFSAGARGGVVCVGGSDADSHHADAFLLTIAAGKATTTSLPSLPIPLANMAGALFADTIYIAGGAEAPGEKAATNRAFILPLDAPAWREISPLPGKARILATGAEYRGEFLVIGGVALVPGDDGAITRDYLRDAWAYSSKDGWRALPDLPAAAAAAPSPAPLIAGRIWIIGGDDGTLTRFSPVENHPGFPGTTYSYGGPFSRGTRKGEWRREGTALAPRATVPAVPWLGTTIIPSGEVRPGVRSPEIWRIDATPTDATATTPPDPKRIRIRAIENKP